MSILSATARALVFAAAASLAVAAPAPSAESKAESKPAADSKGGNKPAAEKKAPSAPRASLGEQIAAARQKLDDIRQAALKANPKLVKRQKELDTLMLKTVKAQGVDPEKDEKRLSEIRAEIKAMKKGEFDHKRHLALSDEHRAISLRLAKAREEAMEDENVTKTREALREDTLAAMRKQDPKTPDLLAELEQLTAEAREINAQQRRRR